LFHEVDDRRRLAARLGETRISTLARDALTTQPTWVIDHIRNPHDNNQLNGQDTDELVSRIARTAAHLDVNGRLPAGWPEALPVMVNVAEPDLHIG